MVVPRDRPYSQFNFEVDLEDKNPDATTPLGGFQEVAGLGFEVTVAEYRPGNKKENAPYKINTRYKVSDVTLKRGVIGELSLYKWLVQIREGAQKDELKTVTISLISEDHSGPVEKWTLSYARPIKYTGPPLSGKNNDIAIEELVLSCEDITLE